MNLTPNNKFFECLYSSFFLVTYCPDPSADIKEDYHIIINAKDAKMFKYLELNNNSKYLLIDNYIVELEKAEDKTF